MVTKLVCTAGGGAVTLDGTRLRGGFARMAIIMANGSMQILYRRAGMTPLMVRFLKSRGSCLGTRTITCNRRMNRQGEG